MVNEKEIKVRAFGKKASSIIFISALAVISLYGCGNTKEERADTDITIVDTTTTTTMTTTTTNTTATTTINTTETSTTTTTSTTTVQYADVTYVYNTPVIATPVEAIEVNDNSSEMIETNDSEYGYSDEVVETTYDDSDVILLAKLINHEASATWEGKVAVGSCVVNRMNYYNQSVSQVIFAPNQFTTASSLTTYTDDDYKAAEQVLNNGSSDTRLFFFTGCHPDRKNHFEDINHNWIGAI